MKKAIIVIIVVAAFGAGFIGRGLFNTKPEGPVAAHDNQADQVQWWTCSMHPQIHQPKPGKCPICFMDLIPVETGEAELGARQIAFSENALKLMEVETTVVERKFVTAQINMAGKIGFDESRIKTIAAWAPGRIDQMYVDFTGTAVKQGDHLVSLYSPQLLGAQGEYIQTWKSLQELKPDAGEMVRQSVAATHAAAREKLRLLGVTKEQIETLETTGQAADHLTIYAPIGGVVIEKQAKTGDYVETGQVIYTVADLARVWVQLDAYESDLLWLRYGQKVDFTVEAYPGEVFSGVISFIAPILDSQTRTAKIRVIADNSVAKLKPEMFVRASVQVKPAADGSVSLPEVAGKWICPMHPDIVKEAAGSCDICGMNLVTTESLGLASTTTAEPPLVIPATAALITGRRAVVYVKVARADKPTFEGREIVLGARAGDYYLVKSGLNEGDPVVTKGNFKIDAALQIQAKPSMMSVGGDDSGVAPAETEQTLCPVMGNPIDKKVFIEYQGQKVYFCCPGCEDTFLKDPQKYMDKLPQFKSSGQ